MNTMMRHYAFLLLSLMMLLSTSVDINAQSTQEKDRCEINVKRMKFKKRSGFFSKIMYDLDNSESAGYRCLVDFYFTSKDTKQRTIDPSCFYLVDKDGNIYEELDTESGDYRKDVLSGPEASSPNMPLLLKLTFIVPDETKVYTLKFKDFK